ncbi:MAG TPA: hypothetical protein VFA12_06970 [Stellaceae bacterium]|nr:hypothetical protein [Stellaceae bacterium]
MATYRVHLFPVMRVVYEVEARSARQAVLEAEALLTDDAWRCAKEVEYAGDPNTEAIVDALPSGCEVLRDQFYELKQVRRE